jgi:hypothetical protein
VATRREAAKNADWMQVVLNGGPPCFHYERVDQRFCLRAERWLGHGKDDRLHDHEFVSLADLLTGMVEGGAAPVSASGEIETCD